MRINPSIQVQQSYPVAKTEASKSLTYQARVLKRALESQQDKESQLLKMLAPKGQVIDIKA